MIIKIKILSKERLLSWEIRFYTELMKRACPKILT